MADVSTITANGVTYNIKDTTARSALENVILTLTVAAFSTLPQNIDNSKITADMVVLDCSFSNPSAIASYITWTTSAGRLRLAGTMSGTETTTAVITLGRTSY
jgi:hypothetical protein